MNTLQNPFDLEENLTPWFELNPSFQDSQLQGWNSNFKKQSNSLFMPLQNTITYFTKHAVLASLLLFISLGSVTALAAEFTLPQDYKPSTVIKNLFAANQQPDTDPYTRLVFDGQNDVVSLDNCDLAVKYPSIAKQADLGGRKVSASQKEFATDQNHGEPVAIVEFGDDFFNPDFDSMNPLLNLDLACYEGTVLNLQAITNKSALDLESDNYTEDPDGVYISDFKPEFKEVKLTKDELRDSLGWFVTESEITNIRKLSASRKAKVYSSYTFKYVEGENGLAETVFDYVSPEETVDFTTNLVAFEYQGRTYTVEYYSNHPHNKVSGLYGNQIQLQFNSIVKNEPNVILRPSQNSVLDPVKVKEMEKTFVNDTCHIQAHTSYTFSENIDAGEMKIVNKKVLEKDNISMSNDFIGFINKQFELESENGMSPLLPAKMLLYSSCFGFYSYYSGDIASIEYPGVDLVRAVYALEGQAEVPTISIYIFAQKSDNLILLNSALPISNSDTGLYEDSLFTLDEQEKCIFESQNSMQCFSALAKTKPNIQALVRQKASNLVQTFALE